MAKIMDSKIDTYKGEAKVFECIEKNLPEDIICYYNREVMGKQFDFCLLIEHMGLVIIEVKGWNSSNIIKVENPDTIYTTLYNEPVGSPKKQARSYKFALINTYNNKYNINPLIMDMVCYPFMSEHEYKKSGLNMVSEPEFTLFKEDIEDATKFAMKIAGVYQKLNQPLYDKTVGSVFNTCRLHFETSVSIEEETQVKTPYSEFRIYPSRITLAEINEIVNAYFAGIKQTIFVSEADSLIEIAKNVSGKLKENNISISINNFLLVSGEENEVKVKKGNIRLFNFEGYAVSDIAVCLNDKIYIRNGRIENLADKILIIIKKSGFNIQQYEVEHCPVDKDIVVKAGAGTGKTYSMISRISYLCHVSSGANLLDMKNEIAMLTFTTESATNMKTRLKQAFMNYFVLTRNKKYLALIAGIENMRISTIHSFSNAVIADTSLSLGIGTDFSTISGNYQKYKIFDQFFNEYLQKKNEDEPIFFGLIPGSIYEFRKMILKFAESLYNKGYDVKTATDEVFGKPIGQMPYMKEIITEVIVKTEQVYSQYLYENNSISLNEYMIYLNKCVGDDSFNENLYMYKYVFIDEFQDVDDSQISAFLEMQRKLGFHFFVVGDLKQSIYRFRGSTMDAFNKIGCNSDWCEYTLNTNYRSERRLLERYTVLFESLGQKSLIPYAVEIDELIGVAYNISISEDKLISVYNYDKNDEKENKVYEKLFEIVRSRKIEIEEADNYSSLSSAEKTIAILVRTNYQIGEILRKSKDQNDLIIESDSNGDLYKLQSSIDLCKLTSALSNPRNSIYLFDLLLSNNVNIDFPIEKVIGMNDDTKLSYFTECLDSFYKKMLNMTWNQLVYEVQSRPVLMVLRKIYDATKPWKTYSYDEVKQIHYRINYDLVFEELSGENRVNYLTLDSINESLHILINTGSEKTSRSISDGGDYVKIICTTVHKSKGLEYDMVVMPVTTDKIDTMHRNGLDVTYVDGKVGYCISVDGESMANEYFYEEDEIREIEMEESRILYVALTRAINKFCWFNKMDSHGNTWGKLLEEM